MKTKVLFLIESLSGGGAERVLVTLLQNLDYSKFNVTLCCLVNKGKYQAQLPKEVHYEYILPDVDNLRGLRKLLYSLQYKLIYDWIPLSWVYSLFISNQTDVEVAFVEGFATKLLAHSSNRKAKKIAWVHCDMEQFHWTSPLYGKGEEERAYMKFDKVVTVSFSSKTSFLQIFPKVNRNQVGVVYNPINTVEIQSAGTIGRSDIQENHTIRLVSVGRLTKVKAFDRLVRIVCSLRTQGLDVELLLLGEGEERHSLEAMIQELGIGQYVHMLGFQSNPYQYMAQCDLFVCSSLSEGFSTAVTEALILGLPVVTTDCSGMHELLDRGPCGVITDNSEEALEQGLTQVLSDSAMLSQLRANAQDRGRDFDLHRLMQPFEMILGR